MNHLKSVFILISLLSLWGCSEQPKEAERSDKYCLEDSFKKDIEFVTAARQQVVEGIHLTGTVEANPDKVIVFKSLFSGVVSDTYFSLGNRVSKGQVLAEIGSTEYSSLRAELQSVESQTRVADSKLNSVRTMFNDGVASQKELNEAQSELDILNAERLKISSNRSLYSASNTKNVFQIKAPATGIVTLKGISPGMQITAESNEPLFTISNLDDVWVMANVYASNIGNIREGMEVEIRTMSYPDEVFKGKISVLSQILDESAKVLKARIVLKNTDLKLKPGMLADITVLKKQNAQAVAIPASGLIFFNNENYTVVYKGDCEVEARKVTLMSKNNETAFIRDGLEENEKVITRNQLLIFNRINQ